MALTDYKITDNDVSAYGATAAPEKMEGDPAANKAVFDRLIRERVKTYINGLIDALTAAGADKMVSSDDLSKIKVIRLGTDNTLQTSGDGTTWTTVASSGHIICDIDGNAAVKAEIYQQRS